MLSTWIQGRSIVTRDFWFGAAECLVPAGAVQCLSAPLSPDPNCIYRAVSPTWWSDASPSGALLQKFSISCWAAANCLLGPAWTGPVASKSLTIAANLSLKSQILVNFSACWLLSEVSINNHQLDVLHSPDAVDCFVRHEPRAIVDDLHSVCDVFCCAKVCRLYACGYWGFKPAAKPNWFGFVDFIGKTDILRVMWVMWVMWIVCVVRVVRSRKVWEVGKLVQCLQAAGIPQVRR